MFDGFLAFDVLIAHHGGLEHWLVASGSAFAHAMPASLLNCSGKRLVADGVGERFVVGERDARSSRGWREDRLGCEHVQAALQVRFGRACGTDGVRPRGMAARNRSFAGGEPTTSANSVA